MTAGLSGLSTANTTYPQPSSAASPAGTGPAPTPYAFAPPLSSTTPYSTQGRRPRATSSLTAGSKGNSSRHANGDSPMVVDLPRDFAPATPGHAVHNGSRIFDGVVIDSNTGYRNTSSNTPNIQNTPPLTFVSNPYPSPSSSSTIKSRARKGSLTHSNEPAIIQQNFPAPKQPQHQQNIQVQQAQQIPAVLSRKFVARRISEGETGRLKEELKCQACGKGYKHISSLAKHLWEHTPEWRMTSKLLISKHQQVQLLEAASILVSINEPDEEENQEENSATAGSVKLDGQKQTNRPNDMIGSGPLPLFSSSPFIPAHAKLSSPAPSSSSNPPSPSMVSSPAFGNGSQALPTDHGLTPSPSPQPSTPQLRFSANGGAHISSLSSSLAAAAAANGATTTTPRSLNQQAVPTHTRSYSLTSPPPSADLMLPKSALSDYPSSMIPGSYITDSLYPSGNGNGSSLGATPTTLSINVPSLSSSAQKKKRSSTISSHSKTEALLSSSPAALSALHHNHQHTARSRRYSTSTAAAATVAARRATRPSGQTPAAIASSVPNHQYSVQQQPPFSTSYEQSQPPQQSQQPSSFSSFLGVFRANAGAAPGTGAVPSGAAAGAGASFGASGSGRKSRRPSALDPPSRISTRSTLDSDHPGSSYRQHHGNARHSNRGGVPGSSGQLNGTHSESNSPLSDDQNALDEEDGDADEDMTTQRAVADDQGVFGDMD